MTYAAALDLILGYYGIWLAEKVKDLTTIILPFGKFRYNCLPMGLQISANVFQREMGLLFQYMESVLLYIDNILIITKGNYQEHLATVQTVLLRLQDKGMLTPRKLFSRARRWTTWDTQSASRAYAFN